MNRQLLQRLPKMDVLLAHPAIASAEVGAALLCAEEAARTALEELRRGILDGTVEVLPGLDILAAQTTVRARASCRPHPARRH